MILARSSTGACAAFRFLVSDGIGGEYTAINSAIWSQIFIAGLRRTLPAKDRALIFDQLLEVAQCLAA